MGAPLRVRAPRVNRRQSHTLPISAEAEIVGGELAFRDADNGDRVVAAAIEDRVAADVCRCGAASATVYRFKSRATSGLARSSSIRRDSAKLSSFRKTRAGVNFMSILSPSMCRRCGAA